MRYRITITYDGTNYSGWQIQPNGVSIQKMIEDALSLLLKAPTKITASGRTDAGVHALAQVAHFDATDEIDQKKIRQSLNGILPKDIRIKDLEKTSEDFHARYSAQLKTYEYHVTIGDHSNPFTRKYSYFISYSIDLKLFKKAAKLLQGTHDFKAFANDPLKGSAGKNSIRTLKEIVVVPTEDGLILKFTADGFLYKMVRNLVGAFLYLAKGKITLDDLKKLLASKDRTFSPPPAPANGLFLKEVQYKK